jgi:hypothetical protein
VGTVLKAGVLPALPQPPEQQYAEDFLPTLEWGCVFEPMRFTKHRKNGTERELLALLRHKRSMNDAENAAERLRALSWRTDCD